MMGSQCPHMSHLHRNRRGLLGLLYAQKSGTSTYYGDGVT